MAHSRLLGVKGVRHIVYKEQCPGRGKAGGRLGRISGVARVQGDMLPLPRMADPYWSLRDSTSICFSDFEQVGR